MTAEGQRDSGSSPTRRNAQSADASRKKRSKRPADSRGPSLGTAGGSRSARGRRNDGPTYRSLAQGEYGQRKLFAPRGLFGGSRLALVVGAAIALALVFLLVNAIGTCVANAVHPAQFEVTKEQSAAYQLNPADLLSLDGGKRFSARTLGSQDADFSLNEDDLAEVKEAVEPIEKAADCGFMLVDLGTGRALSYNAGSVMYFASAVKAPLAEYAVTHPSTTEGLSNGERRNVEDAIVWSSNTAYFSLCKSYFNDGYREYLREHGVSELNEATNGRFPSMDVRSMASLWTEIYQYLNSDDENASWLGGLFGKTDTSFVRTGLEGTDATVRDKAGWIAGTDSNAVCDGAIISADGRDYLMVIGTGQRDTEEGRRNVANLARALYDVRGLLGPKIAITY